MCFPFPPVSLHQDDDVSGGSGGKAGIPSIPTAAWEEEDLTAPVVVAVSSPGQMSDMELTGPLGPVGADSVTADVPSLGALLEDEPVPPGGKLDAGITADVPRLASLVEEEEGSMTVDGGADGGGAANAFPQVPDAAEGVQADVTAQMDLTLVHGASDGLVDVFVLGAGKFCSWWAGCALRHRWRLFRPDGAARRKRLPPMQQRCRAGSLQLPTPRNSFPFHAHLNVQVA